MASIEEFLVNYWVNKRNNRINCCSMQNVLSWFKALKSHALSEKLMQTNSILHSRAKASISHPFKVLYLFGWICNSKLLLSLSTYKINYPSKYNLLLQLFLMHSCHTLFNHRIFSQIKGMHISAISFFSQFSVGTCPHTLFPLPPLIDDAHEISLFASKWTWKLWLTNCNQFLHLMSL